MVRMPFFLDFDGTLHPTWTSEKKGKKVVPTPYEGPWCVEAPTLERILRPYLSHLEIVISSWWAYKHPLDQVRAMLPEGLATHVTDSIWLPELMKGSNDYHSHFATRFNCIEIWLKRRRPNYTGPWLALDDEDESFPPEHRDHLIHAWGTLASTRVQDELEARLAKLLKPSERGEPV